jgi:tRNA dimethylallyltransferase
LSLETLQNKLKNISPSLHNTTDLLIKDRVIKAIIVAEGSGNVLEEMKSSINPLVLGVFVERDVLKQRITERLKKRLNNGMIEEVEKLVEGGLNYDKLDFFGLEYRYIGAYLKGELNYNDMYQKLNSAIHKFAKRQMTWFRKMEREGISVNWLEGADYHKAKEIIEENYFDRS